MPRRPLPGNNSRLWADDRKEESLAANMRYFDGNPPDMLSASTPWPQANFVRVDPTRRRSRRAFFLCQPSRRSRERSKSAKSRRRFAAHRVSSHCGWMFSRGGGEDSRGCEQKIDPRIRVLFGGPHLVGAPDPEIQRISASLRDQWKVDYIAIGHGTGEPTFAALQKTFWDRYIYVGVGAVVNIP
jgi:7,8-dihydropterin-6-yl-methyl-4-(beta-D-ribofuranosyl)aminobenzene 5'-phosphate synthase